MAPGGKSTSVRTLKRLPSDECFGPVPESFYNVGNVLWCVSSSSVAVFFWRVSTSWLFSSDFSWHLLCRLVLLPSVCLRTLCWWVRSPGEPCQRGRGYRSGRTGLRRQEERPDWTGSEGRASPGCAAALLREWGSRCVSVALGQDRTEITLTADCHANGNRAAMSKSSR